MTPARTLDDDSSLSDCFHDSTLPRLCTPPPMSEEARHSGIYLRRENRSVPKLYDGPPVGLTSVAAHAHTVADTLRASFGTVQLGGFIVELTVPEQTTNGGLLALQRVVLRSPAGLSLVVGAVNVVEKYAEMRSFAYVRTTYERRFKRQPDFDGAGYRALRERAAQVFENFALAVRVADPPDDLESSHAVESGGSIHDLARVLFYAACVVASAAIVLALLR